MPLTEKQLKERDAKRNIGEELLAAVIDVKEARHGHAARPGCQSPSLPNCWGSLYERFKNGSKGAVLLPAQHVPCCT